MQVLSLEFYQILSKKLGEKEAEAVLKFIESEVKQRSDEQKEIVATKKDIADLKADLRVEIRDAKVDTVKWIVSMSLIQVATMIGALLAIVKFLLPH